MANMSYCRFSNTLSDLRDCYEHMNEPLSDDEARARQRLVEMCENILTECCDEVTIEYPGDRLKVVIYDDEEEADAG
jgi:hypothetical protein